MPRRIWAIALNTYREALRQKVLYTLVFFCVVLILLSRLLGQLSLGADAKIVKDTGLAAILLFGSLISIFVGVGLVFKEIERRTIYTILSKPVSRAELILGKFVGLTFTLALEVAVMTLVLFVMLMFYREPLDFGLLKAIVLIYAELCVLTAIALLFSSYSSSFMSVLFCLSFWIVGHLTDDLLQVSQSKLQGFLNETAGFDRLGAYLFAAVVRLMSLYNLDHFAISAEIVHGVPISWAWVVNALFYAVCYVILLLSGAIVLFRRKDLQ
ncbi:MAG TPA: ABC transporter permease [Bdellovibrionota bacterium]|nr:ABC transporter permease [Bdellovibrionota bacterium]